MREDSLVAAEAILDNGHAADALGVLAQLRAQLLQEAPVDVEDDLHVPWQQLLYQAHRPLLQRLRQHRVVRERKHLRTVTRAVNSQNRNTRQPFCTHHRKGIMRSSILRALLVTLIVSGKADPSTRDGQSF